MTPREVGDEANSLARLSSELSEFASERDWGQFHTPRNLLLALVGEVGELAEQMQWVSDDEILARMKTDPAPVEEEMADVAIYLLRLASVLGVDLSLAIERKMKANERRYPIQEYRGRSDKAPEEK